MESHRFERTSRESLVANAAHAGRYPDGDHPRPTEGVRSNRGDALGNVDGRARPSVTGEGAVLLDDEVSGVRSLDLDLNRGGDCDSLLIRHGRTQGAPPGTSGGDQGGARRGLMWGEGSERGGGQRPCHRTCEQAGRKECVDKDIVAGDQHQRRGGQLDSGGLGHSADLDGRDVEQGAPHPIGHGDRRLADADGGDEAISIHGEHRGIRGFPGHVGAIREARVVHGLEGDALPGRERGAPGLQGQE